MPWRPGSKDNDQIFECLQKLEQRARRFIDLREEYVE